MTLLSLAIGILEWWNNGILIFLYKEAFSSRQLLQALCGFSIIPLFQLSIIPVF
jgi:hypothetical protein